MKKGDKWLLEWVKLVFLAVAIALGYLLVTSCTKPNLTEVRGENCICSEAAKKTNSDFCKQICYTLGF